MSQLFFWLVVTLLALRPTQDPDFGWHLKVGEYILKTGQIPRHDLFSFSLPGYPYVYHSWLSDILIAKSFRLFGLWGPTLLFLLVFVASIFFIYQSLPKELKENLIVRLTLLFFVPISAALVGARIRVFSFLALSILYFFLKDFIEKKNKFIFFTPILFLIWANLHGGFILGVIFLTFAILILFFQAVLGKSHLAPKDFLTLFSIWFFSLITPLFNPYFIGVYRQAFQMGTNSLSYRINADWQPILTSGPQFFYGILIALIIFFFLSLIVFSKAKIDSFEKILFLAFSLLTFISGRFLLVLLVILIPQAANLLAGIRKNFNFGKVVATIPFRVSILVLIFTFLGVIVGNILNLFAFYSSDKNYARLTKPPYPFAAVEFLKNQKASLKILNDFNWGGYLIWQMPERKVFSYGAMDNFFVNGHSFAQDYLEIVNLGPRWRMLLEDYKIEGVFVSKTWPVIQGLSILPDWRLVFEDEQSVIFFKVI